MSIVRAKKNREEIKKSVKKYINQQEMKHSNTADVFALVRNRGGMTRKQIAEKLGMSWGAVSTITSELIENGYLIEAKPETDRVIGRTPSLLEVNGETYFAIGLDLNDTGLRAVAVNLKNEIIESHEAEADFSSVDSLISGATALTEALLSSLKERTPICIGIAMQGIVDSKTGVSVCIPGRTEWKNVPIADILKAKFGLPVTLEHDPNCILFAARRGKIEDTLLIRVDHGIGMAVMLGGKIIDKPGIFELGHVIVEQDGIPCNCGKRGCLDQYASIRGLEARSDKKFHVLVSDAEMGDEEALFYFHDAACRLADAISNAAYLINVDHVVLCGRLFEHRDLFWDVFTNNYPLFGGFDVPEFSFVDSSEAPFGAALIAMSTVLKKIAI